MNDSDPTNSFLMMSFNGDVGIFTIWNKCFLKELVEEVLISRNKDYNDIPGDEKVRLVGKVIRKVE